MSSPTPKRLRIERGSSWTALALSIAWLAGRILGDGSLWTGLLFYIPTLLPAAAWLFTSVLLYRHRKWALLALCAALLLTAHMVVTEMRASRPTIHSENPSYTLVHWNVFRNFLPWRTKIERLRQTQADIFVLNELPRQVTRGNWALKLGPGMDYAQADLMIVACKGRVSGRDLVVKPGLIAFVVDCRIHDEPVRILAVDMAADVSMARDPVLAELVELIEKRRPDLVAGDFNAPRRSRRLQPLPLGYTHAYETVGAGWPYTWPMPFPLLAIDQCMTGPRVQPLHHRYVSTASSDHRMQILRFALRH